jgi:DNA-binding MarR family transcriptional regulator
MIKRQALPGDRRQVALSLTPQGRARAEQLVAKAELPKADRRRGGRTAAAMG